MSDSIDGFVLRYGSDSIRKKSRASLEGQSRLAFTQCLFSAVRQRITRSGSRNERVQTFISTEVSNEMHNMKKQALISCSDKSGVVEFAKALTELGYHILSTGGTAKLIAQSGIPVQEVADYTGFPEMLDGRVKTLNPKIHAGILARRPVAEHMEALKQFKIDPIDIVAVNLYPFEQAKIGRAHV